MPALEILDHPITAATVWTNQTLGDDAGRVALSDACLSEILNLAKLLDDNPLPINCLRPDDFELPHCSNAMRLAKTELEQGCGFVLIDKLPLDRLRRETAVGVYWLLAAMIGRAVAQKWDGKMIYGVADVTGKKPGNGIRPDVTNAEQNFHTDNSYNIRPPDHVALLCLHPAKQGGISRVTSLNTAHNFMREKHPKLLARLYQPFYFDRQREHAPDDVKYIERPALTANDDRLTGRFSAQLVRQGYQLAGGELDQEGADALAAFYEILNDANLYREFFFEPGQIQIINNRVLAHKRTKFADWPEPDRKRHLVRLWLRRDGRAFYNG